MCFPQNELFSEIPAIQHSVM